MRTLLTMVIMIIWIDNLKSQLIINEIMFDPAGSEYHDEFVELYNTGATEINLSEYEIGDQDETDLITPYQDGYSTILQPYSYCIVMDSSYPQNSSTYENLIPENVLRVLIADGSFGKYGFSNSISESVVLKKSSNGVIIDQVSYVIDQNPGYSEERVSFNGDIWKNSIFFNGSPGFRNSVTPFQNDISLNISNNPVFLSTEPLNTTIHNIGLTSCSSFQISVLCDNSVLYENDITNELFPEDSISISIPQSIFNYATDYYLISATSDEDENLQNNSIELEIFKQIEDNHLIFNEFMKSPEDDSCEWIEILNMSEKINIKNLLIGDKSSTFTIEQDIILDHGEYFVISEDSSIFENYWFIDKIIISNKLPPISDKDHLLIAQFNNQIVDSLAFDNNWVDDDGHSIELINPELENDNLRSWTKSVDKGTPGKINSVYTEYNNDVDGNKFEIEYKVVSPNNDGKNDFLVINYNFNEPFIYLTMFVFNIKGQKILELAKNEYSPSKNTYIWNCEKGTKRLKTGAYIIYAEVKTNDTCKEYKIPFYIK
ncbi:MAG: lamin tail domain-containing protein [Candidatus Delongbacteria bacterium]|nr:lamin tail domain-containing protein [Candidatus Delongbacteria bacterium]MBN2835053.1 lamin tail domain-containing protein [Candidatus Delongbacteria bacterium]